MKATVLIILFNVGFTASLLAQDAPELKLVGSNFSYTKGTIDVEVLTEIIQQKQEEVAQRAFRNLVVNGFNKGKGSSKSFTNYYYIYNILQTITTEKNKKVITRKALNSLLEYTLVYGFTQQFLNANSNEKYNPKADDIILFSKVLNTEIVNVEPSDIYEKTLQGLDDNTLRVSNIYLDMAYDVFINDTNKILQKRGLFKMVEESPNLKRWYENDNAYIVNKKRKDGSENLELKKHRELMVKAFEKFTDSTSLTSDFYTIYKALKFTDFKQDTLTKPQFEAMKSVLRKSISFLKNYEDNNVIASISGHSNYNKYSQ